MRIRAYSRFHSASTCHENPPAIECPLVADTNVSPGPPLWNAQTLAQPHQQHDKALRVQRMFDAIAPDYERVNAWSSLGRDKHWRRAAVRLARVRPADRVLDVACGTGDMCREFRRVGAAAVIGLDFAADMLRHAIGRGTDGVTWCRADAQRMPFVDSAFDVVSCAFGVRNFQSLHAGLCEMRRVLAPGGRAVILEFSMPCNRILNWTYRQYLAHGLPLLARLLCKDGTGAYKYLPRSIVSFVDAVGMADALRSAGFARVDRHSLTFGAVHAHVAHVDPRGAAPGAA